MKELIRHLRAAAMCSKGDGPTDGQLLEFFVVRRDETAFAALVRRHGLEFPTKSERGVKGYAACSYSTGDR